MTPLTSSGTRFVFKVRLQRDTLLMVLLGLVLILLGGMLHHPEHLGEHAGEGAEAHLDASSTVFTRIVTSLWFNNIFFTGMAAVGVCFVAIHYVSQAGWSSLVKRVPEAFGYWLPFGGLLMLGIFLLGNHEIFHWTHPYLYEPMLDNGSPNPAYDAIIAGKAAYLNLPFYLVRMGGFFVLWSLLFFAIRRNSLKEDLLGGTSYWRKNVKLSAIFLLVFMFSSPVAAWDWIMSIDTHWFSTMYGWYVFASWWVCALAFITYIVVWLKSRGHLAEVNQNHLHDLGKYIFGFSIFWAYIWFSQFMLIYYSNIPEESIYFTQRWTGPYRWLFFTNLILNFFLPFLLLMTRDAKRYARFLFVVCPIVCFGHWIDFLLMVSPGVLKEYGGSISLIEIGGLFLFGGAFLFVLFKGLSYAPLVPKNDPMLEESIHHHT